MLMFHVGFVLLNDDVSHSFFCFPHRIGAVFAAAAMLCSERNMKTSLAHVFASILFLCLDAPCKGLMPFEGGLNPAYLIV